MKDGIDDLRVLMVKNLSFVCFYAEKGEIKIIEHGKSEEIRELKLNLQANAECATAINTLRKYGVMPTPPAEQMEQN